MENTLIKHQKHNHNSHLSWQHCLFLGSLSLSLVLRTLLTGTGVARVAASLAESSVGTALNGSGHLALLDLLDAKVGGSDGEDGGDVAGLVDLGDVGLGVALLGSVALAGEENQALLVGLEAGDVDGERLLAEVLAAEVDGDADGGSLVAGDTSLLLDFVSKYNSYSALESIAKSSFP